MIRKNKTLWANFFSALFFLLMLISCGGSEYTVTEREREEVRVIITDNDGDGPVAHVEDLITVSDSSYEDLSVTCESKMKTVKIMFAYESISGITGYKVYWRENDTSGAFVEVGASALPDARGFTIDMLIDSCKANYFYMTALGDGVESDPSPYLCVGEACPEELKTMSSPTAQVSQ
ncbi:MAG: hypothetical protein A2504_09310 [Bdellovibrionales bacterium RIFOXYD12_FULL_39_22]|nr:MAG: hypothetical protein A2385_17240 [Bdellovibrionales bacterium RIFOXYB1_FULL_39_21]OFZ41062.1 MAG: hypothetical protein A2485_00165 [Bdellovibrionales bacterium RIFOXYC12_FULL_39_17]OFZ50275.1 MAG: hypothetical protein A2404_07480 [Bdellovibrionales bacterium RIFOXYC1_FULL_39_130]OFZ68648.1 MAG: hypothetical protein A2451_12830 [Bdellovibrionales bacterium RIFOXYC2_FULL_39_8]OFZ75076.1 MAG: hypothetical protein A2560_16175 [Bdellovibrionales bacterium RIFOXYD1_FULL_39_84]OFZ92282.1 MAG: